MYQMKAVNVKSFGNNLVYLDINIPWNDTWINGLNIRFISNYSKIINGSIHTISTNSHSYFCVDQADYVAGNLAMIGAEIESTNVMIHMICNAQEIIIKHLLDNINGWESFKNSNNISKDIEFKQINIKYLNEILSKQILVFKENSTIKNVFKILFIKNLILLKSKQNDKRNKTYIQLNDLYDIIRNKYLK